MTSPIPPTMAMSSERDLHSPERQLIELKMAHADLNALIDDAARTPTAERDDLRLRRMKKRRLVLRDEIALLESDLLPKEPA